MQICNINNIIQSNHISRTEEQSMAGRMEDNSFVSEHHKDITHFFTDSTVGTEQTVSCNDNVHPSKFSMKGKRAKRFHPEQYQPSPTNCYPRTLGTSIIKSNDIIGSSSLVSVRYHNNSSVDKQNYMKSIAQEEEDLDMANCLILLAQGDSISDARKLPEKNHHHQLVIPIKTEARRKSNNNNIENGYVLSYGYECKTCYKTFASFQALGGHRSSCNKKPRKEYQQHETIRIVLSDNEDDEDFIPDKTHIQFGNYYSNNGARSYKSRFMRRNHNTNNYNSSDNNYDNLSYSSNFLTLQLYNTNVEPYNIGSNNNVVTAKRPRVHECLHCGATFASGQALGGHMRRHRGVHVGTNGFSKINNKDYLCLDLNMNLPAPGLTDDDHHHEDETKFGCASEFAGHPQLDHRGQVLPNQLVLSLMSPTFVDFHH